MEKSTEYIYPAILTGLICPYCGRLTEFVDSKKVYGKSYGMIYLCESCDAFTGVHEGTSKAHGRLGNKELREAKHKAHQYFDKIARTSLINKIWDKWIPNVSNRNKAYKWLAQQMGIDEEICHIGMMDVEQCMRVIEICKPYLEENYGR